jgi:hypothetical protein
MAKKDKKSDKKLGDKNEMIKMERPDRPTSMTTLIPVMGAESPLEPTERRGSEGEGAGPSRRASET